MNKSLSLLRADHLLQKISDQGQDWPVLLDQLADKQLLSQLIEFGLPLSGSAEGGIVLTSDTEDLSPGAITSFLSQRARAQLKEVQCLKITDSTNRYLLDSELPDGGFSLVTSECQVGGKGRRGNEWISPYGRHLYLSIACRLAELSGIETIPLNVAIVLRERLIDMGYTGLGIKWPNDLYHNGKKLGGILVETRKDEQGWKLVIGLGINLREDKELQEGVEQPVTFLESVRPDARTGRNELVANVVESVLGAFASPLSGKALQSRWRSADICLGRLVRVITEAGELMGRGGGIDENGAFILITDSEMMSFHSGEISLRLQK